MEKKIKLTPFQFSHLKGDLHLEPSKSIANRALLLQFLASSSFELSNYGNSDDVLVMESALRSSQSRIDLGMAGTAFRFLTAGFAITPGVRIIDGHDRLKERPIAPLVNSLRKLGASISYLEKEGYLPLKIEGSVLKDDSVGIDQNYSSQFVSALMLIAPFLPNGLRINRTGELRSESYIELTKCLMDELGFKTQLNGREIKISKSIPNVDLYKIEADWSAAAYWFAFVVLVPKSNIVLIGLKESSCQADKKMLDILSELNLSYSWINEELHLSNSGNKEMPKKLKYDCSQIPDQAQTLAFLYASLGIELELSGLQSLKYKETNRIEALKTELTKLGLTIETSDSTLNMSGEISVDEVQICTYNDHRMAMSSSLLATRINTIVEEPNVVSKSYPNFWSDLKKLTT